MKLSTSQYATRRIAIILFALVLIISGLWYRSYEQRNARIQHAVAQLRKVTYVHELWRSPRSLGTFGSLLMNNPLATRPPDGFKRYGVALKPSEIDDQMIERLIAIERLDSITVMSDASDERPRRAIFPTVPLSSMPLAASPEAVKRLLREYPELYVYVDPLLELVANDPDH